MKSIKKYEDYLNEEDEYDEDEYDREQAEINNNREATETTEINVHIMKVGQLINMLEKYDKDKDLFFMCDGDLKFPNNIKEHSDKIHFNISRMPKIFEDEDEE